MVESINKKVKEKEKKIIINKYGLFLWNEEKKMAYLYDTVKPTIKLWRAAYF